MLKTNSVDEEINNLINMLSKGYNEEYRLRLVETEKKILEPFFYNPTTETYDKELKELYERFMNFSDGDINDFFFRHPLKYLSLNHFLRGMRTKQKLDELC